MAEDRFQKLKEKYVSVLNVVNREDIQVQNLHLENNKLFLRGVAKNDASRDKLWDAIKKVNPNYSEELHVDISVSGLHQQPKKEAEVTQVKGTAAQASFDSYTVQKGDTLSQISKQFYGNANEYNRIFEANRDQLKDPDRIYPGQVLKIPKSDAGKAS